MNKTLIKQAQELANQPYITRIMREIDDEGVVYFVAENPEIPGCRSQGADPEEAKANLAEARVDFLYFLLEDGKPIPSADTWLHKKHGRQEAEQPAVPNHFNRGPSNYEGLTPLQDEEPENRQAFSSPVPA